MVLFTEIRWDETDAFISHAQRPRRISSCSSSQDKAFSSWQKLDQLSSSILLRRFKSRPITDIKQMFVQNYMNYIYEETMIKNTESYAPRRYLTVFICPNVLIMILQPSPWLRVLKRMLKIDV